VRPIEKSLPLFFVIIAGKGSWELDLVVIKHDLLATTDHVAIAPGERIYPDG